MLAVQKLTNRDFTHRVLHSKGVAIVDFGAEWCPPCKALMPVLEELAQAKKGRASFYSVDVDAEQDLAARYGIRGLPTVLVFKDGNLVEELYGKQAKEKYSSAIDRYQDKSV